MAADDQHPGTSVAESAGRRDAIRADDRALSPEELAVIARILARQLGVRQQQYVASSGAPGRPDTGAAPRPHEGADGVRIVNAALAARHLREIDELSDALKRLGGSDYGICVECGMAISYQRLLVLPEVRRCASCEAFREQRSRYPPGP